MTLLAALPNIGPNSAEFSGVAKPRPLAVVAGAFVRLVCCDGLLHRGVRSLVPLFLLSFIATPSWAQEAPAASAASAAANYALSPNDVVQIRVFQEDELSGSYRISPDGTVNFPLAGTVQLAGKTPEEAAKGLGTLLARYLKRPHVNISVLEFTPRRYTIMGQVQRPGTYVLPVHEKLDLLSAIAIAGGFTRVANDAEVTVKRQVAGQETFEKVDTKSRAKSKASGYEVREGDQITVPERLF